MINVDKVFDFFQAYWKGLPKRPSLDKEDSEFADFIIEAFNAAANGSFQIFKEEMFTEFEDDTKDSNWTPEDEEYHSIKVYNYVVDLPGIPNVIQFSRGEFVELDKVKAAVEFYGSRKGFTNAGGRLRPTLETMKSKFRFIKDQNHLAKLREYEDTNIIESFKCASNHSSRNHWIGTTL